MNHASCSTNLWMNLIKGMCQHFNDNGVDSDEGFLFYTKRKNLWTCDKFNR